LPVVGSSLGLAALLWCLLVGASRIRVSRVGLLRLAAAQRCGVLVGSSLGLAALLWCLLVGASLAGFRA
jgi:hypothetical protein